MHVRPPVVRTIRTIWAMPVVHPGARFVAVDTKTTIVPSALSAGVWLAPFPGVRT
jgi:hypothetical protein